MGNDSKKKMTDLHDMSISLAGHVNRSQEGDYQRPLSHSQPQLIPVLSLSSRLFYLSLLLWQFTFCEERHLKHGVGWGEGKSMEWGIFLSIFFEKRLSSLPFWFLRNCVVKASANRKAQAICYGEVTMEILDVAVFTSFLACSWRT